MTAVLNRPNSPAGWASMPGWNVVADLTPPELINVRWLAILRRRILIVLLAIVVLCGLAYVYQARDHSSAADAASAASDQTVALQRDINKYARITRIENAVSSIRGQVAGVMTDDVDVAHVVAAIRTALPNTMSIQNLSLTLTPTGSGADSTTSLAVSGHSEIGQVTVSGSGQNLDDLPAFVDRVALIRGVEDVLPRSNQVSKRLAQFTLSLSLTDQLYSHAFNASKTGG